MKGVMIVKKNNLITGLIYLIIGISCFIIQNIFETGLDSILIGLAGAGIGGGMVMLWKYYYWTRPKNQKEYEELVENRTIDLQDERKEKLRDKSGRYAYLLGLIILSISILVFSVLGSLDIIKNSQLIILYLALFLIFQYLIGIIIYRYLSKKY